jgi:isopentenyl diphosphate isomerase/L-lactate dehydrogenase-like FMN-dependent dehydrogenase
MLALAIYGEEGVSSITKKFKFELESQSKICGYNNLNDYNKQKKCIMPEDCR